MDSDYKYSNGHCLHQKDEKKDEENSVADNEETSMVDDEKIFVADVYCFGGRKKTFSYKLDLDQIDILGSIVKVGFGKKNLTGIVLSIREVFLRNGEVNLGRSNIGFEKLKGINEILYKSLISEQFLTFLKKMAFYNVISFERLIENVVLSAWLNKKRELKSLSFKERKKKESKIILSKEQQNIADSICTEGFGVDLLYGAMGSGKTYIFLEVMRKVLLKNSSSQVLLMVPEISLTSNLIKIVYDFYGIEPVIWHSSVPVAKKKILFENIINGKIRIVISTRSGLLLPYKNLSLIVIDEEHDISYKQDEIPVYNARDMAILRAKYQNIPVVLASATPSLETVVNVIKHKYKIHKIDTQFFKKKPPEIEIINLFDSKNIIQNDLQNIGDKNGDIILNYISRPAREAIVKTLEKHEQSLVFINRRGYSRTLKCDNCGFEVKCKNCDNLLSYHKRQCILKCHYCGYIVHDIKICSHCGSDKLSASRGAGVEQIDKEIHSFCNAKTLIFSSDEINKEHDVEDIANEIKNGEIDIIVGTQIISKGHHFPRLTNIVVLDIDALSLDSNFRSFERTFQMLFQLSGRAGRELDNAKIFIQTTNPGNFVLQLLKKYDIKKFYAVEIEQRKKFNLPPYSRFIAIIIASENKELALKISNELLLELQKKMPSCVKILGPSECEMHFLKRNYRYRFLIKSDKNSNDVLANLNEIYSTFECPRNVLLKIDVDPYSSV